MNDSHDIALRRVTRALRASMIDVLRHLDDLSDIADGRTARGPGRTVKARSTSDFPVVDRATLAVLWRGRRCVLGNTIPFHLMERLALRPGQYISVKRLLEDHWGGPRAASTVRSAVSELRGKLVDDGMADLASRIDGSNRGHYGLRPAARRARSDGDPTGVRREPNRRRA